MCACTSHFKISQPLDQVLPCWYAFSWLVCPFVGNPDKYKTQNNCLGLERRLIGRNIIFLSLPSWVQFQEPVWVVWYNGKHLWFQHPYDEMRDGDGNHPEARGTSCLCAAQSWKQKQTLCQQLLRAVLRTPHVGSAVERNSCLLKGIQDMTYSGGKWVTTAWSHTSWYPQNISFWCGSSFLTTEQREL